MGSLYTSGNNGKLLQNKFGPIALFRLGSGPFIYYVRRSTYLKVCSSEFDKFPLFCILKYVQEGKYVVQKSQKKTYLRNKRKVLRVWVA